MTLAIRNEGIVLPIKQASNRNRIRRLNKYIMQPEEPDKRLSIILVSESFALIIKLRYAPMLRCNVLRNLRK